MLEYNETFILNKINKLKINLAHSETIKNWTKRNQIIEIELKILQKMKK